MSAFKFVVPRSTTNLIDDPSFEFGSGRFSAPSSTFRDNGKALFGLISLRLTHNGIASYIGRIASKTWGSTNETLFVHGWVWVNSANWDGGDLSLDFSALAGSTVTQISTWVDGTDPYDQWFPLIAKCEMASDVTGAIDIVHSGSPTSGAQIWVDGWQAEIQPDSYTTYCDGEQPGCDWDGAQFTSTSSRPADTRLGGVVLDAETDLGIYVEEMAGIGFPAIKNIQKPQALIDGLAFQRTTVGGSKFRLLSRVIGSSLKNYHANRRTLVDALKPDADGGNAGIIMRYHGAGNANIRENIVRLSGGFELSKRSGFSELIPIELETSRAFWRAIGRESRSMDGVTTMNSGGILARVDGQWTPLGLTSTSHSTFTRINDILYHPVDGVVYVAGNFTGWDNGNLTGADHFVQYNLATGAWERCGAANEVNGQVYGITFRPNGGVYLVGSFTNLGGALGDTVSIFDGGSFTAFSAVTDPQNTSPVRKLALGKGEDKLYIAGEFLNFGGDADADGLASYDLSADAFADVGTKPASANTYAVAVDKNGDVIVGGNWSFTDANGDTAYAIARWDGSNWYALGSGIKLSAAAGTVYDIFVDANGDLIVVGSFDEAGGSSAANVARWNGSDWYAFGLGISSTGWKVRRVGTELIVGFDPGSGPTAGGLALETCAAAWDGSVWRPLDVNFGTANSIRAVENVRGDIWLGTEDLVASVEIANATTISPVGNAKSYPVFIVKDGSDFSEASKLVSITNETMKRQLFFNRYINQSELLTIDLQPGQRKMVSNTYGESWEILPSYDVPDFWLEPDFDNIITAFVSALAGTPTPTVFVQWVNQYWGVD